MAQNVLKIVPLVLMSLVMAGCSSAPAEPDYRYEEQKRAADKAQKELSREMKRY